MDAIKFAQLISYISNVAGCTLATESVQSIYGTIENLTKIENAPSTHEQIRTACGHEVATMLIAMRDRKLIDAIKACRMLTGLGLKEAKDMIEEARRPYPGQI